jgi:hypothetical protein
MRAERLRYHEHMRRSIYAPGSVVKLLQQAPRHRGPGRVGIRPGDSAGF